MVIIIKKDLQDALSLIPKRKGVVVGLVLNQI